MKKLIFIGFFVFYIHPVFSIEVSDTLILDGWAVEIDQDSLEPLSPDDIDRWEQDFKPLPPTIIWHHSLGGVVGFYPKPLALGSGKVLLASRDENWQEAGWQFGVLGSSCAMLTNNIGIGVGASYSAYRFSTLTAKSIALLDGQLPYQLSVVDQNAQVIIQQPVGNDLYELDTILAPIQSSQQKVRMMQFPFLLRYVKESRSEIWRFHAGMGVLVEHVVLSNIELAFVENEMLGIKQEKGFSEWRNVPIMMIQVDRAFSSRNSIYFSANGIWPNLPLVQGEASTRLPNWWISCGWAWKFNNNPYIRAR